MVFVKINNGRDENMLFSELFNIKCMGDEEWFNPILTQDTL